MSEKHNYFKIARIVFIMILAILISGCNSPENFVVVPTSDNTPPTAGMTISQENSNTLISVNETSQPVTVHAVSDVVTIIAGATDNDGGIKEVSLWATVTYYKPGQIVGPGLVGAPIKNDVSNATVGQSTLKHRFFLYNYDLKTERGGWSNIKVEVWTEGKNFFGGTTRTPVVSINYP